MEKLKRGASPGYSPVSGSESVPTATKRRQLRPGSHVYIWENRPSSKQVLPPLRRLHSAGPVASDKCEQQTTWDDLEHWRSREEAHRPPADGIAAVQHEVTTSMRRMLVDWLGEVRDEFRLHTETLFLAVAYLDRYLAAKSVPRGRFQLLGLTCLWVAAKFEEVYPPPLKSCLAMAENMYTKDEIIGMEKEVLFTLAFQLAVPTPFRFLHYLLQLSPLPAHPLAALSVRRLAEALLELSLLETDFLRHSPSHVAATAVYLALGLVRHHEGLAGVVVLSGASCAALGGLVKDLSTVLNFEVNQPQSCALLSRYNSWEDLHGRQARDVAAATAAAASPRAAPPSPWPTSFAVATAELAHEGAQHAGAYPSQPAAPLERCIINLSAMSSLSITATAECC